LCLVLLVDGARCGARGGAVRPSRLSVRVVAAARRTDPRVATDGTLGAAPEPRVRDGEARARHALRGDESAGVDGERSGGEYALRGSRGRRAHVRLPRADP